MINRGFSYSEINSLPLPVFRSLEFFDRFIEPSNIDVIDSMFAKLNRTMYAASGKWDQQGLRKLKASDFKIIRDETIFKSPEELEQEKRKKEKERLDSLSPEDRKKYEEIKKRKGAKNGKRQ